jgi:hypothetical protein
LTLYTNLSDDPLDLAHAPAGRVIHQHAVADAAPWADAKLAPWSVIWTLG